MFNQRATYALLKKADLYIGNDSGPLHLASAARVPSIEISCHPKTGDDHHSNSPKRFAPWGVTSIILQPDAPKDSDCSAFCKKTEAHCITQITPDMVLEAAEKILASKRVSNVE